MPGQERVVAVDCETTGFGRYDRVLEIAVVEVDIATGRVIDEFETLVDPVRDVGPVDVHGVTASMVSAAPTFDEVAGALARRVGGATLVAHNLAFDARFLRQEFERLGTDFDPGSGFCTLRVTSQKLGLACERFGVPLTAAHRALGDARATARLAMELHRDEPISTGGRTRCRIGYIAQGMNPRTLRRPPGTVGVRGSNEMVRIVSRAHYPFSDEALLSYTDMLDWALDDHVITDSERRELRTVAADLGISEAQVRRAHRSYFDSIVAAVLRDHIVTPDERALLERVAYALDINDVTIPQVTDLPAADGLEKGMRVCFTGTATVGGETFDRSALERMAAIAGLVPVRSVTKKNCDLLVAADIATNSGKARKARAYGIPLISVADFVNLSG
ncbi:MAG: exonuclease domain-containing protein [bacterium]|nr:exonuclease domain-containing protein [bacterium]